MCVHVYVMVKTVEAQFGMAPCENDLLPLSSLSNESLFSDVWRSNWGGVCVWGWGGDGVVSGWLLGPSV